MVISSNKLISYDTVRNKPDIGRICHAPFKSMLFSPSGQVMVCHYNRGYKIGRYPADNLTDIWTGKPIEKLRKSLSVNDMSQGCHQCFNDLSKARFFSSGCLKYDNLPDSLNNYPVLMEFQLSNLCNLECMMCSGEYSSGIRINREKMPNYPTPYDDNFVGQLIPFIPYLKKAYFTGGEPFIIPIYRKIWKSVSELNPDLEMNISTNGSYLDEEIKSILHSGKFNITLSIDSLNPKNYGQIRKNAHFETTLKNIDYLHHYAKEHNRIFSVKFVLFKQNFEDVPTLFEFFNNKNIQLFPKLVWMPFKMSLFNSTSEELLRIISVLKKTVLDERVPIQKENSERFRETIEQLNDWHVQNTKEPKPNYQSLSLLEMKSLLQKKIMTEISTHAISKSEKELYTTRSEKCLKMLSEVNVLEEKLKQAYLSFLSIPTEFILFEILRDQDEKLIARFIEETT
ncbi:MAG: radical SAM protein [Bacteroidales bacterium]|nr:radical SAM protein [Bacteroidales bacterium]